MKEYVFKTGMKVRDYECDIQGVVNNANYQHYLEVTRHEWLNSIGESFSAWHNEGIDCMVSKVEIQYKAPLRPQEEFISCLNIRRDGVRYIFLQDIYRKKDEVLCTRAKVDVITVVNGVLTRGDEMYDKISKYLID